jgi:chromosome segregation ATPase
MLTFLPHLLGHTDKTLGTLLHIGAGVGSELSVYDALHIKTVVAVEADNVLFKKLQTKAKRYQNVQVIQGWVAGSDQQCNVYEISNPRFNSLLAPDALYSYFSNLKTISTNSVKPLAIGDVICQHVDANPAHLNILVLEAQGYEAALLKSCAIQELYKLDWLVIRSSEKPLYKTAANSSQLIELTSSLGYEFILQDETHTPFVEYYFRLNRDRLANRELESRLRVDEEKNAVLKQKLAEISAQLANEKEACIQGKELVKQTQTTANEQLHMVNKLKDELFSKQNDNNTYASKLSSLEEEKVSLEQQNSSLKKQQVDSDKEKIDICAELDKVREIADESNVRIEKLSELVSHLETEKQKLQSSTIILSKDAESNQSELKKTSQVQVELQEQLGKQEELNASLNQQLSKESQALAEYKQENQASSQNAVKLAERVSELESQLSNMSEGLAEQTHWHSENKKWAEQLQTQLYEKIGNFDELQKQFNASSSLSSKIILKAQLDLDTLRRDYQNKVESENQLLVLVKQLREKLETAANYYFNLQKEHPELIEKDMRKSFGSKSDE